MIGVRLRVARARMNYSMRELGGKLDVSANMVKKYEHDESMPSSSVLMAMCRELDVSVEWLLSAEPLDFRSTEHAPQGRHAKYWVQEAFDQLSDHPLWEGLRNAKV